MSSSKASNGICRGSGASIDHSEESCLEWPQEWQSEDPDAFLTRDSLDRLIGEYEAKTGLSSAELLDMAESSLLDANLVNWKLLLEARRSLFG